MKRIIWDDPVTGIASVCTPAYNDVGRPERDTDDALIDRVIAKDVPKNVVHHVVDDQDIGINLRDRSRRNDWVCDHTAGKLRVKNA